MSTRPPLEVADIFRAYGQAYRLAHASSMLPEHRAVMRAIERCRTAALGGHVEACDSCDHLRIAYNSCGNRHCPKCQSLERARWLEARYADLLPVEYFHVVFTVPEQVAAIALQNKRLVYGILFEATAETLQRIAADPKHLGAEIGFVAVLHTWGQNLLHHPHLHCVVPGGGLSPDGARWIACRRGFFLPVRVLSKLFRRLFVEKLRRAHARGEVLLRGTLEPLADEGAFEAQLAQVRKLPWVVYAKRPFGGPDRVLDYLGRYTHRVAISNNRLVGIDEAKVCFRWKDYRNGNRLGVMSLDAPEFIRRFLLHVLPAGFQRIRHFGLLSNRQHATKFARCRSLLGAGEPRASDGERRDVRAQFQAVTGKEIDLCPACGRGRMRIIAEVVCALMAPGRHWTADDARPPDSS